MGISFSFCASWLGHVASFLDGFCQCLALALIGQNGRICTSLPELDKPLKVFERGVIAAIPALCSIGQNRLILLKNSS